MGVVLAIFIAIYIVGCFTEKSDLERSREIDNLPPFKLPCHSKEEIK